MANWNIDLFTFKGKRKAKTAPKARKFLRLSPKMSLSGR